ncbi:MAG: MotA/TolQ/ExbB proton channel family protein [Deltaproteobacteria bacterium]|nr:MotA/TolQ/ExbB proton channel family protein [Deltaproteobacteria bacterium]
MKREQKKPLIGIVIGAVLTALAPLVGLLITIASVNRSFAKVEGNSVDPADKAKVLASGISSSMNATAIGIGLGALGLLVLVVSILLFLRATTSQRQPPSEGTP